MAHLRTRDGHIVDDRERQTIVAAAKVLGVEAPEISASQRAALITLMWASTPGDLDAVDIESSCTPARHDHQGLDHGVEYGAAAG